MYVNHYNLKQKPFEMATDPQFFWLGQKHAEAFQRFRQAINENKKFLTLTGDVGTGKTTLLKNFLKEFENEFVVAMISNPDLNALDFINYLSEELEMGKQFKIPSEFFIELTRFLHEDESKNSRIFLAIDEGHHISPGLLQIIQDILKIGVDNGNLAGILLVGHLSMNEKLKSFKYENADLPAHIQYQLDPLTETETRQYIQHRLLIAGSEKEIFTADAVREIYLFSLGYPIMINIICDRALLTGYADGRTTIDNNVIRECAQELSIHSSEKKHK